MINSKKNKEKRFLRKLKKKGQIEIQFNWMFVLIAGGLILVFFSKLVLDVKKHSEQKIALVVMRDLETIATGAGVSKGTAQVLDKPDYDIIIDCGYDMSCDCNYKIGVNNKPFADKRIFGPEKVVGEKMVAWTLDWSAPFRVNNFLLLTSPDVFYFLVHDDSNSISKSLVKKFNDTLPSQLEYEFINVSSVDNIQNYNYPVVKMVYLHTALNSYDADNFTAWRLSHEEVKAVVINITGSLDFNNGSMRFYKANKDYEFVVDGEKLDFVGDESMFAAMFAGNYDNYACNIIASFERLERVGLIYKQRANSLHCPDGRILLNNSKFILSNITKEAGEIRAEINRSYSDFYDYQTNLSKHNIQLQIKSCTTIY